MKFSQLKLPTHVVKSVPQRVIMETRRREREEFIQYLDAKKKMRAQECKNTPPPADT